MTDTTTAYPAVGERIYSYAQFEALPVGATINQYGYERDWQEKTAIGWFHNGQEFYTGGLSVRGVWQVRSLPDNPVAPPQESLLQYMWRYRTHILTASLQYGYEVDGARRALREMGCEESMFPFGTGMALAYQHDFRSLGEGSVVHVGKPDDYGRFGSFARRRGQWVRLLGQARWANHVVVDLINGEEVRQEWIDTPGTADSVTEIADFKAKAYKVGFAVKRSHGWCETYDAIVAQVGIDRTVVRRNRSDQGVVVGSWVAPTEARALPVGTLLRWQHHTHPESRQIWYMRVDDAANTSGTRRMFGWRDDGVAVSGHYADRMQVMGYPQEINLENGTYPTVDISATQAWAHLPVGTRLAYAGQPAYVKTARGITQWRDEYGTRPGAVPDESLWTLSGLNNDVEVVSFPTPTR